MAQQTIIAYFDSRSEAQAAQAALIADGVAASAISLLPDEQAASTYTREASETSYDRQADRGGFWASLGDFFLPDEDRYAYAEGMSRGGVALSVMTDDASYERVADLLERSGADNIDEREAQWKSAGWSGYAASDADVNATAMTSGTMASTAGTASALATDAASTSREAATTDDGVIQVVEEQLRVGKRMAEGGRVRIRSYVREVPVEAQVELRSQRVTIERHAVDRPVAAGDAALFQDRTIEAVERREEAVIAKEARVVEEIGLRSQEETQTQTVSDTVRKTEVEVVDERTGQVVENGTTQTASVSTSTGKPSRT